MHQDTQLSNAVDSVKQPQKNEIQAQPIREEGDQIDESPMEANQKRLKNMSEVQGSLDEKDKKLKDMQMNRLQGKLRYFIRIEKELRAEIENVTEKDKNLVQILENAICFGKVLFVIKPVVSQQLGSITNKVDVECGKLYKNRDSENWDQLQELGRAI